MSDKFRITLGQLNATVGDIAANAAKAMDAWQFGRSENADFVALPEMFLSGYQIQDLVFRSAFLADIEREIANLAKLTKDGPALGIGAPVRENGQIFNAYHVLHRGRVVARMLKHHLPNDDVFDEERYFATGDVSGPYRLGPIRIGSPICEDAWYDDVTETLAESGADILLVPNGSPYARNKNEIRQNLMVARVIETGLPLIYLNLVGGQDDQVFDGGSFALNARGHLAAQMPAFSECMQTVELRSGREGWEIVPSALASVPDEWEQDYNCAVLALRDYMRKTGFRKVLLGMSGGVDSALVATIATDALGAENVRCVMLPSEYTSEHSLEDASECARLLGCRIDTLPISAARKAVTETLAPIFDGLAADVTEENIQSRLRGLLLMALSNKFGEMLLTTGNKSEVAVGYATIYGDMAGGYNPIKDLYKMRVFETCRWRNANHRDWMMGPAGQVIPPRIIDKPPSAELRADQKDEDSLPPYDVLDAILEALIDDDRSVQDVVAMGYDRETVKRVEHLIYISEYKRFQSAPGARLTRRAFWLDRRYPIANRWRNNDS